MTTKEITSYPDNSDSTPESQERPQPGDSILQPPQGGQGATSPADNDSQWDLPSPRKSDPSSTM